MSVLLLENSDRTLTVEREKIARLSAGTRFHEVTSTINLMCHFTQPMHLAQGVWCIVNAQVQATNDAARFRTEHLGILAEAERAETVRMHEAQRSLAALVAQQKEDEERMLHQRKMQDAKNEQSVADAEARTRVAELDAQASKMKVLSEYGDYDGFLRALKARTLAQALSQCPHSMEMQMQGFRYVVDQKGARDDIIFDASTHQ